MYTFKILQFLIALRSFTNAAVIFKSCAEMNIKTVEQFDLNKYSGKWFLIKRTPTIFGQGICSLSEYTLINETFFAINKIERVANHTTSVEVLGKLQEPNKKTGKFWLTPKQQSLRLTLPMWVIGTDYKNYAVLWTCIDVVPNVFSLSYQLSWVLSRKTQLSSAAADAVDGIINSKLPQHTYKPVEQRPEVCGKTHLLK